MAQYLHPTLNTNRGRSSGMFSGSLFQRFFRRFFRLMLFVLVVLPLVLFLYSCATQSSIRKRAASLDYNPLTRVVRGTEARTVSGAEILDFEFESAGNLTEASSLSLVTTSSALQDDITRLTDPSGITSDYFGDLDPFGVADSDNREASRAGVNVDGPIRSTAILLIHGYLSSNQDFGDLPERLASRGYTVRLMRLPGHGTTPLDLAGQPDGAFYEAVKTEYEALAEEYDRVRVVGFSLGGALSTILSSEYQVDRLGLVAPYYKVTYKSYYVLTPEMWQACMGWAVPMIKRPTGFVKINNKEAAKNYFMYHAFPSSSVSQLMAVGKQARQPELLGRVSCPVLMIHSPGDGAASPDAAGAAFKALGSEDKRLVWLDGEKSNHVILWDYEKDKVLDELLQFLTAD